jgi:hypothetical protein
MIKKKEFHFTFKVFLRLLIFFLIIYLSISYFSSNKEKDPILGDSTTLISEDDQNRVINDLYQRLPESSRHQLENFQDTQIAIYIKDKTDFIKEQTNGFPDRQIKEFQKSLIKKISQDMIDSIDNPQPDENN